MTDTGVGTGESGSDTAARIMFLTRALQTRVIGDCFVRLGEQARAESWTHEQYLAAVLDRQVSAREAGGITRRISAARFPAVKTLEEFNFEYQPSARRDVIANLATCNYVTSGQNVVLLGPPGTGKTHLGIGLGIKAAQLGHRVIFATAAQWLTRLHAAHSQGTLTAELAKLRRYQVLIIDEVGYIPFEADAGNLFFQLVASRYEQASLIVTSNMPFARWGDVFGDEIIAGAMIDRLVHHAEVLSLKGDSYRTRTRRKTTAQQATS